MRPPAGVNLIALSTRLASGLEQQVTIAGDEARLALAGKVDSLLFRRGAVEIDRVGDQLRKVEPAQIRLVPPAFDPGDSKHRIEQGLEPVGLAERLGQRVRPAALGGEPAKARLEPGQRRSKLVRDAVRRRPNRLDPGFDPVQHEIESRRQPVEIVAAAVDRDPSAEIARHDLARGVAHRSEAAPDRPVHQQRAERGQDQGGADQIERRRPDRLLQIVQLLDVAADHQPRPVAEPPVEDQGLVIVLVAVAIDVRLEREPARPGEGRPARQVGGDDPPLRIRQQVKPGARRRRPRPRLQSPRQRLPVAAIGGGEGVGFGLERFADMVAGPGDADQLVGAENGRQRGREEQGVDRRQPEGEASKKPHSPARSM